MKMSEFLRTNGQLAINPHIAHNPVLSANACLHQLLSQDRGIDDECSGEPISFQQQSREATAFAQPHAAGSRCAVHE
jgi:hypothetical protein